MIGTSKEVAEAYLQYTLQETYGNDARLNAIKNTKTEIAENDVTHHDETVAPLIDYEAELTVKDNINDAKGWQTSVADIIFIQLARMDEEVEGAFLGGEKVRVTVRVKAKQDLGRPIIGFVVRDRLGQELFGENTLPFTDIHSISVKAGEEFFGEFVFHLPMLPNGQYAVMASVADGSLYDHIQHHFLHDALILTVTSSKIRWGLVGISFDQVVLKIANE